MDREEHGKARAGKITGTLAHTVMYGGADAWATAINNLWADTGEAFAASVGGARGHGIEFESVGASKFWVQHPEYDVRHEPYVDYRGASTIFRGLVGVSPDRVLYMDGLRHAGLEVKSPTEVDHISDHLVVGDPRGSKHFCQCQHGMMVLGVPQWFLVVHFEEQYFEYRYEYDSNWQDRYQSRLAEFILQFNGAKPKERRKLRITDV